MASETASTGGSSLKNAVPADDAREGNSAVQVRAFDEDGPDGVFHFHLIRFSRKQIYVWVGFNQDKRQGSVHAAVPTKFDVMPLTSTLVGQSAETDTSTMAARLSRRAGCGVILASSLPKSSPMLQAFAERRLVKEIDAWVKNL